MSANFRRFYNGIQVKVRASTAADTLGELEVVGTTLRYHNGSSVSPIVTESHASQGANRLQNKDLEASTTKIVDATDTTKKLGTDLSGATTGKTMTLVSSQTDNRSLTLPDATDTLVGKATTDILQNKTLGDATDSTKDVAFDISGATTGKTTTLDFNQTDNRTITFPDATTEVVGTDTTQTLTNKTMSGASNTFSSIPVGAIGNGSVLSGTNTGDVTLTAAGSTPNANAASLSGQALTLQPADATNPGIVSTTTQTFGGQKNFNNNIGIKDTTATQNVILAATSSTTLTADRTITLDTDNVSSTVKLSANLTVPSAATVSGTNTGDITLGTFGTAGDAKAATLSGQVLTIQQFTSSNPGAVPASGGGTSNFLRADGSWSVPSGGSATGDTLVQQLDTYVSTIQNGEALSALDAVSVYFHNGSGSNLYKIFQSDADESLRSMFRGFAKASASATANIKTYTIDAAYVASNHIPIAINGRTYFVDYASSSDATLQALATLIATDQDIASATVTVVGGNQTGTDDRVITITGKGCLLLNITGTTITGGASQPGVTIAETQAAAGQNVDIHEYGPLAGFSSLVPGQIYYLSGTRGAISTLPGTYNVPVGQALDATHMFVDRNITLHPFQTVNIFVRSHGGSTGSTMANGQLTSEHFDSTSWSTGVSDSTARSRMHQGDMSNGSYLNAIDSASTGGSCTAMNHAYNKASWAVNTNRGTPKSLQSGGNLNGNLVLGRGVTGVAHGSGSTAIDVWNGSSWSNPASDANSAYGPDSSCFVQGGLVHWVGGLNNAGSGVFVDHTTFNGASSSTATNGSQTGTGAGCGPVSNSRGITVIGTSGNANMSQTWDGSSWSSLVSGVTGYNSDWDIGGTTSGWDSSTATLYIHGGNSANTTSVTNTQKYIGTTWSTTTSSSTARAGAAGGVL